MRLASINTWSWPTHMHRGCQCRGNSTQLQRRTEREKINQTPMIEAALQWLVALYANSWVWLSCLSG